MTQVEEQRYEARQVARRSRRMILQGVGIGVLAMGAALVPWFAGPMPTVAYGVLTFGSILGGMLAVAASLTGALDYRKVVAWMDWTVLPTSLTVYLPMVFGAVVGATAGLIGLLGFVGFEIV